MKIKNDGRQPGSAAKAIRLLPARSRRLIALCGKCGRKLKGGFGSEGDKTLVKRLRAEMTDAKGKRAAIRIVETRCLDICPKHAVAVLDSDAPGEVMIVAAGASVALVAARLGERRKPGRSSKSSGSPPP